MPHEIDWRPSAIEDLRELFEYLAEHATRNRSHIEAVSLNPERDT
ncbi:hypothetical protein [Verminephrobacter aporrectodeae]|nr:hypothetical protein [Verminephrobacter aporrectodeae]